MKKGSQCSRILRELRKGRTLTMLDIFKLCGSMNGHKRVSEIPERAYYPQRCLRVNVCRSGRWFSAWRLA